MLPAAPDTVRSCFIIASALTCCCPSKGPSCKFTPSFFKCLDDLKKIFNSADTDGTGTVERDELNAILKEKAPYNGEITSFLKKVQTSTGVSFEYGYDTLFDLIESDDDGHLTWDEFETFFLNVGWSGGSSSGTGSKANSDGFVYIIERCSCEFDEKYDEMLDLEQGRRHVHPRAAASDLPRP